MSRPNYGPGDHCRFNDYPQEIGLVVGTKLASESDLFKEGQYLVLQQTLLSGTIQGNRVVGEELPKKAMIYTDTGEDDSFNLKIEYYGWGEFYLRNADDDYFTLDITKGQVIQAGDWDNPKSFEIKYTGSTQIPGTESMAEEMGFNISTRETEVVIADLEEEQSEGTATETRGGETDTSDDSDTDTEDIQEHCVDVLNDEGEVVGQFCY